MAIFETTRKVSQDGLVSFTSLHGHGQQVQYAHHRATWPFIPRLIETKVKAKTSPNKDLRDRTVQFKTSKTSTDPNGFP